MTRNIHLFVLTIRCDLQLINGLSFPMTMSNSWANDGI